MSTGCVIQGCGDPVRARGLCGYHYMQNWHNNTHTEYGRQSKGVNIVTPPKRKPQKDPIDVQVSNFIRMLDQSDEEVLRRVLEHYTGKRLPPALDTPDPM